MAKQQEFNRAERSPLVPITANAFLGPAFNACMEPFDLEIQDLDLGLLRYTRARAGNENISPHPEYYGENVHRQATVVCSCSPLVVSPWSSQPGRSSTSTSPDNLDSLFGSLSPSSCLSAFSTPVKTPRLKIRSYSPAQLEEDVLLIDGVIIKNSSNNKNNNNVVSPALASSSFVTPDQSSQKQKSRSSFSFESSATCSTGVSSTNGLYKTEICRSWEDSGTCRYGLRCQFAHGKDDLRPAIRHPKYKTEICRAFTMTGNCLYGSRCRFIHRLNLTDYNGDGNDDLNLSANIDEIFSTRSGNSSPSSTGNRTLARRLPIFRQICPEFPDHCDF